MKLLAFLGEKKQYLTPAKTALLSQAKNNLQKVVSSGFKLVNNK